MSNPVLDPVQITIGAFEEVASAIQRQDPRAFKRLTVSLPERLNMLRQARDASPQAAPMIDHVLMPLMQRAPNLVQSVAKQAAVARRVNDTAEYLEAATHVVPICFDGTLDAGTNTADVSAPHSGQPWRYLAAFASCTAAVGVRLTSFEVASTNHISTSNVSYGTAPTAPGIDLSLLTGSNHLAANRANYQWRPWGIGRAGVLRPDAHVKLAIANRSGATATTFIGLMVQSNPCGEAGRYQSAFAYKRGGKSEKAFIQKVLRFSMFG